MLPRQLHRALTLVFLGGVAGGCAAAASSDVAGPSLVTSAPNGASERIPVTVARPAGAGPFPAVVILHDCSGLGPRSSHAPARWARELTGRGYVVVMPDSFGTRGFPNGVCTDPSPARVDVSPSRRQWDAYAALAHARALPDVDGRRGGGPGRLAWRLHHADHDGSTRQRGGSARVRQGCRLRRRGRAVSGLRRADRRLERGDGQRCLPARRAAPDLDGALDDWTPAEPCRRLVQAARGAGEPVAIKIYPGAHHSFDSANPVRYVPTRINANSPTGRGATTGGNAEAWADSIREVAAFFERHLAPPPGPAPR